MEFSTIGSKDPVVGDSGSEVETNCHNFWVISDGSDGVIRVFSVHYCNKHEDPKGSLLDQSDRTLK